MLFNSFQFLVFFPIATLIYFLLPHKFRWFHLLLASCLFYCAFIPVYILILFFTIIIDYIAGILIERTIGPKRKYYLVLSLISNIGILLFFKYCNFFIYNFNTLLHTINSPSYLSFINIILPIGLSFHTFQAMSYTIEVYRGNQKVEKHFGIYALYVMFYPQLVAGPIERPQNMIHQFYEKKKVEYANVSDGLKFMLWGMFKKVVIADRLASFTDPVFNFPKHYSPAILLIAAIFFSFQIYCDFSGYSDIAIGAARVMGFKLMTNFNRPYNSKTISEFWKRWHISLSTWFKDYLYIPLGGNRVAIPRTYFNLFIVFLVSGFWHGASWTFIIWGAIHGGYLIFAIITQKARHRVNTALKLTSIKSLYNFIQITTTFCLVTLAWVFFRAKKVNDAFYIIKNIFIAIKQLFDKLIFHKTLPFNLPVSLREFALAFWAILFLEVVHLLQRHNHFETLKSSPIYVRWTVYYFLVFIIAYFGVFENREFIYFQF